MIKIAQRLKPFSHRAGASCLLPGTWLIVEAFPTLLRIGSFEIKLPLTGPVADFTLEQDLEKHCVFLFGKAREGFFKLRLEATSGKILTHVEKGPLESQEIEAEFPFVPKAEGERLSFGSHKAQDWDLIERRADLKEWIPLLFYLGQKIPFLPPQPLSGTARLLEWPADRNDLAPALNAFFKAAFTSMLIPRLQDDQHQGLSLEEPIHGSPFFLLQEGSKRLRSLFFRQNERRLALLPHLPVPLDAGRALHFKAPGIGTFHFEWSKKLLRRVILEADTPGEVLLDLQSSIRTYRINKKQIKKRGEPLLLEKGKTYLLDRFEG